MGKFEPKVYYDQFNTKFIVRAATKEDGESVLSLAKEVMQDSSDFLLTKVEEMTMTVDQESEWLESIALDHNQLALVVEKDFKIIGFLNFSAGHRQRIEHTGEFGMSIHKDYRGQGIGSKLIDGLIEWAKKHPKIEKIKLQVHETNKNAIALYTQKQFSIEGTLKNDLKYENGRYVDSLIMALFVK